MESLVPGPVASGLGPAGPLLLHYCLSLRLILILGKKSREGTSAWHVPPVTDGRVTLHISAPGRGHPEGSQATQV